MTVSPPTYANGAVTLAWGQIAEWYIFGWWVWRSAGGEDRVEVSEMITPNYTLSYSWDDANVGPGDTYRYWLREWRYNGSRTWIALGEIAVPEYTVYVPMMTREVGK